MVGILLVQGDRPDAWYCANRAQNGIINDVCGGFMWLREQSNGPHDYLNHARGLVLASTDYVFVRTSLERKWRRVLEVHLPSHDGADNEIDIDDLDRRAGPRARG